MPIAPTTAVGAPIASTYSVPALRTAASMSAIRASLSRAIESVTGRRATSRTVDVLASQVSLETAGGSQMFNFNFGGIKGAGPGGATASYMTREVLDGSSVHIQQGFRAYSSLDAGARDYVSLVRSRFPQAFHSAAAGDLDGFAHALKSAHYYTAPESEYAAGLRSTAGASGAPTTTPSDEYGTSAQLSRIVNAVVASATRIADPDSRDETS
jgi:flagellum-specific peptidoglycan hydrolase FlgJ